MKPKRRRAKESAMEALTRKALALYQGFKRSNDIMFWADSSGRIVDVNDAFCKHYGYAHDEVLGKSPAILRSRHSTDELYRGMWAGILDPKKGYWRGRIVNKAKDGREIPLILTITAVRDSGKIVGFMSNAVDISDQLALESRVAQSEALASLGEMAAVVAHEIRNPLGSIVMAAQQLSAGELEEADRDMIMRVLRSESQRLNAALTNFLSFARPREIHREPGSLNALVEEVSRILKSNREILQDIRLAVTLDKSLAPFPLDSDQIRQVLWNVAINAVQALEGRGSVFVKTGRSGDFAFLAVEDTGPGIPPEKLPEIFKPFQTTKRQGTGLGLAVAERIVKAHGGRIEVANRPGKGARFIIHLPYLQE